MVPTNSNNPVDVAAVLRYESTSAKRRLDLSFSGSSKGPLKAGCYEGGEKVGKEVMDVIAEEAGAGGEEYWGGDEGVEEEGEEEWGSCDPSECDVCDENGKLNVSKIQEYLRHKAVCQCDKCARCHARKCDGCCEGILRQDAILDLSGNWGGVINSSDANRPVVIDLASEGELTLSDIYKMLDDARVESAGGGGGD
jgi:hypothetical protein